MALRNQAERSKKASITLLGRESDQDFLASKSGRNKQNKKG